MDAVTYPNMAVSALLNENFVPVKIDIEEEGKLVHRMGVIWTPTFLVMDAGEKRISTEVGWLPPSEFVPMLYLSMGHVLLHRKKVEDADKTFSALCEQFPTSHYAAEALYYSGVSRYLASRKVEELKDRWQRLQQRYPRSTWALRSDV